MPQTQRWESGTPEGLCIVHAHMRSHTHTAYAHANTQTHAHPQYKIHSIDSDTHTCGTHTHPFHMNTYLLLGTHEPTHVHPHYMCTHWLTGLCTHTTHQGHHTQHEARGNQRWRVRAGPQIHTTHTEVMTMPPLLSPVLKNVPEYRALELVA